MPISWVITYCLQHEFSFPACQRRGKRTRPPQLLARLFAKGSPAPFNVGNTLAAQHPRSFKIDRRLVFRRLNACCSALLNHRYRLAASSLRPKMQRTTMTPRFFALSGDFHHVLRLIACRADASPSAYRAPQPSAICPAKRKAFAAAPPERRTRPGLQSPSFHFWNAAYAARSRSVKRYRVVIPLPEIIKLAGLGSPKRWSHSCSRPPLVCSVMFSDLPAPSSRGRIKTAVFFRGAVFGRQRVVVFNA